MPKDVTITEETIGGLFAEDKLTPAEFGLIELEVRRYGACHPSETSPCEHTDTTDNLVKDVYRADGTCERQRCHGPCELIP